MIKNIYTCTTSEKIVVVLNPLVDSNGQPRHVYRCPKTFFRELNKEESEKRDIEYECIQFLFDGFYLEYLYIDALFVE